jgi:hypothetical protein
MSHCPYGLQAEKAYLDVIKAFSGVADVQIKFVPYIMHGYEEAVDNIIQHCVAQVYPNKFIDYMKCYLEKGKSDECLKQVGIDKNDPKFKQCYDATAQKVNLEGIKQELAGGNQFPRFNLDAEEAMKAGVQ